MAPPLWTLHFEDHQQSKLLLSNLERILFKCLKIKSSRLPTWFVHSLGLLLHKPNVRSCSKPPVSSGKRGTYIKW